MLNALAAGIFGLAVLWKASLDWREGYRTSAVLWAIFGVYLLCASSARAFNPSLFTDCVKSCTWVARLSAGLAIIWRIADSKVEKMLGTDPVSLIRTEIEKTRNGD